MIAFLEFLPLVVFFAIYKFQDIYWATASLIVTSAILLIVHSIKERKIVKKHLIIFGIALVFGSLTLIFRNDAFIKWKVTVVYTLFAGSLLVSQYWFNKNPIKELMKEALELPENIWSRLNMAWASFFAFCAVANIFIAFNLSQETWVNFKVFGLTIMMVVFSILTIFYVYRFLPEEEEKKTEPEQ